VRVFCLGAGELDRLWDVVGHHIEKFVATRGTDYLDDLKRDIRLAAKQLWGTQDGPTVTCVVITRIQMQPRGKVCQIYGMAGGGTDGIPFDREHVNAVVREIEAWAKSIGCKRMNIVGRKGWKRLLDSYAEVCVELEKDL